MKFFHKHFFLLIIQIAIFFVVWKHSFVRADQHVLVFFEFCILNSILILCCLDKLFFTDKLNQNIIIIEGIFFFGIFILSNVAITNITREVLPETFMAKY